jgi:hypothetical protein
MIHSEGGKTQKQVVGLEQNRNVAGAVFTNATTAWQVQVLSLLPPGQPRKFPLSSPASARLFCRRLALTHFSNNQRQNFFPPSPPPPTLHLLIDLPSCALPRLIAEPRRPAESLCTLQLHAFKYVTASRQRPPGPSWVSSRRIPPTPLRETASAVFEAAVSHLYFLSRYPPASPPPCRTQRAPITCNRTSTHGH